MRHFLFNWSESAPHLFLFLYRTIGITWVERVHIAEPTLEIRKEFAVTDLSIEWALSIDTDIKYRRYIAVFVPGSNIPTHLPFGGVGILYYYLRAQNYLTTLTREMNKLRGLTFEPHKQ